MTKSRDPIMMEMQSKASCRFQWYRKNEKQKSKQTRTITKCPLTRRLETLTMIKPSISLRPCEVMLIYLSKMITTVVLWYHVCATEKTKKSQTRTLSRWIENQRVVSRKQTWVKRSRLPCRLVWVVGVCMGVYKSILSAGLSYSTHAIHQVS